MLELKKVACVPNIENTRKDEKESFHDRTNCHLRDHGFEGFHDPRTFRLLIVGETAGNHDNASEHDPQVQLHVVMMK